MNPKVSVITASHEPNPSFLTEAFDSLLQQTYRPWEWRLTLDGDGSLLEKVPERIQRDRRVKLYVNNTRLGSGASRNIALAESEGSFVVNLDADDTLTPNAIDDLIRPMLMNQNVGVVFGRNLHLRPDGELVPGSPPTPGAHLEPDYQPGLMKAGYLPDLWLRTSYHHTSTSHAAYRRSTAMGVGGWGALQRSQDLYLLLMAADVADAYFVDEVVGHYRIHEGQVTNPKASQEPERIGRRFIAEYLLNSRAMRGIAVEDWSFRDRSDQVHQVKPAEGHSPSAGSRTIFKGPERDAGLEP